MRALVVILLGIMALRALRQQDAANGTRTAGLAASLADVIGPDAFTPIDDTPVNVLRWPAPGGINKGTLRTQVL